MIPNKYIELMNGEIDGINSAAESRELTQYLAAEPGARQYFQELREAIGVFGRVASLEPPAGLRERILAELQEARAATENSRITGGASFLRSLREAFDFRSRPSYAYAFVAGLLAGVCLVALVWQVSPAGRGGDFDNVYGTILAAEKSGRAATSQAIPIDLPGISGHTRAIYVEDRILVQLSLESQQPVQVLVRYDERAECEGYYASAPGSCDLTITGREVTLTHTGVGDYDILLQYADRIQPPIEMQIITDGAVLSELTIEPKLE